MAKIVFPNPQDATEDGVLAIGGNLLPETLIEAYANGIFPWPLSAEYPLVWFSPDPRGVIEFQDLHLSRSLIKKIKNHHYQFYLNRNFSAVIHECANLQNRPKESATWITPEMITGYQNLHQEMFAYSFEAYIEDQLMAGLYGVSIDNFVCAESMFHKESNASKILLVTFLTFLKQHNITKLDTQMVSEVVKSLGGKEIPRSEFLVHLKQSIQKKVPNNILSKKIRI